MDYYGLLLCPIDNPSMGILENSTLPPANMEVQDDSFWEKFATHRPKRSIELFDIIRLSWLNISGEDAQVRRANGHHLRADLPKRAASRGCPVSFILGKNSGEVLGKGCLCRVVAFIYFHLLPS